MANGHDFIAAGTQIKASLAEVRAHPAKPQSSYEGPASRAYNERHTRSRVSAGVGYSLRWWQQQRRPRNAMGV